MTNIEQKTLKTERVQTNKGEDLIIGQNFKRASIAILQKQNIPKIERRKIVSG